MGYIARVQQKNIPSVTLPTGDYDRMQHMSNSSLVSVLREHVLSMHRIRRFSPTPPEEHDAYTVRRSPERIEVLLQSKGKAVFSCVFVPPLDY